MEAFNKICRFLLRFRYPFSLPEDVAIAFGIQKSYFLTFNKLMSNLTNPNYRPDTLTKYMPRSEAESVFRTALRKERFQSNSLFSYHVNGHWMEFVLHFDDKSRLRRLYLTHKDLKKQHEIPISIQSDKS